MKQSYKFERFRDQSFPVYTSLQRSCGVLVIPHFHKAAELIKVLEGAPILYIDANRFVCHPGDIIFIPPLSVHHMISQDGESAIRGITFELSLTPEGAFGIPTERILNKNAITEYFYNTATHPSLDAAILETVDAYENDSPTCKLELLSSLYKIAAVLISNNFISYEDYESYDRLQPVIDYIDKNYQREISLSELSGIINVCNDHLIRLFKKTTNKTPIRYIMDLRLQEALKLLLNTDLSISIIAGKVGFSSANYMSRVFTSSLNMTPTQYRRDNRTHRK